MEASEILVHLTWVAPYIGALLALLLYNSKLRDYLAAFMLFLSALASTYTLVLVMNSEEKLIHYSYSWISSLKVSVGVYVDTLAALMGLVVAWLSFLIGFYSLKYMEGDPGLTRYWFFFDFFVGSMLLLVLADNLILMFIGWEGTGLASYALIGHWYRDEEERWVGDSGRTALKIPMWFPPSHSGLRAIVFTRIGDVGLIAGIATLYVLTGTFSLPEIAETVGDWSTALAVRGLLFIFLLFFSLGALAKSAQFPFHEWLVTAMTGPTSVSALIHAATMVKAGVFFMLRFSPIFYLASRFLESTMPSAVGEVYSFFALIALIGGFTAFLMATQAVVARELKLILAFSTASQLGYMFLAVGSAGLLHDFVEGFIAGFNHLMSHAVFKAALFLTAGALIHAVESKYIDDMGGLAKYMRLSHLSMFLAALSLAGLPPFMGFWTKDSVLESAYYSGLQVPFILGLVTAGLTAFYSMRMVFRVFHGSESENVKHLVKEHHVHEAHPIMLSPYLVLALISIAGGLLWPIIGPQASSFLVSNVLGLEEVEFHPEIRLDPLLTSSSVGLVLVGLTIATVGYYSGRVDFWKKISSSPTLTGIHKFLYDRWFINSIYYWVFVRGGAWFSKSIFKWFDTLVIDGFYHRFIPVFTLTASNRLFSDFETPVIDKGYHEKLVSGAIGLASNLRRVQTGRINHYLIMFFIGLLVAVVVFVWVV